MDHLQRLIFALLLWFGLGVANAATTYTAVADFQGTYVPAGTCNTLTCFCDAYKAGYSAANPGNPIVSYTMNAGADQCILTTQSGGTLYKIASRGSLACGANSTKSGSTCTCTGTAVVNAAQTACEIPPLPPPTCKPAQLGSVNYEFTIAPSGSPYGQLPASMTSCTPVAATATAAAGGCTHVYDLTLATRASSGSTVAVGNYTERATGANCTPSGSANPVPEAGKPAPNNPTAPATGAADDPKPTPNPSTICALGVGSVAMCPTLINGTLACVVCGQLESAPAATGGTTPSGGASAPGSGGSTGTAGSGQTVNTGNGSVGIPVGGSALQGTTCTGSVCTTKTFIKDASGSVVGSYTVDSPATVFCASNPGDPICTAQNTGTSGKPGTGSGAGSGGTGTGEEAAPTFGGSCGAGFTCTGDAVQCAMARDQMLRNCKNFDDAASNDPVVVAAAAGASSPAGHPINSGTSKSLTFDQTNILSGSCPGDVSVTVSHFNAVTLPFSSLCTPATWLGNILVGITALSCLGIVFVRGS